jgi:hypothetical protein
MATIAVVNVAAAARVVRAIRFNMIASVLRGVTARRRRYAPEPMRVPGGSRYLRRATAPIRSISEQQ